jgi:hypothetical protein
MEQASAFGSLVATRRVSTAPDGASGRRMNLESCEVVMMVVADTASPVPGWERGRDLSAAASRGNRG